MVGLGPGFVVGAGGDIAVETAWAGGGALIETGPTLPLAGGKPRPIDGIGRERMAYAPAEGIWRTGLRIGQPVTRSPVVGFVPELAVVAPSDGARVRLTRRRRAGRVRHDTVRCTRTGRGVRGCAAGVSGQARRRGCGRDGHLAQNGRDHRGTNVTSRECPEVDAHSPGARQPFPAIPRLRSAAAPSVGILGGLIGLGRG